MQPCLTLQPTVSAFTICIVYLPLKCGFELLYVHLIFLARLDPTQAELCEWQFSWGEHRAFWRSPEEQALCQSPTGATLLLLPSMPGNTARCSLFPWLPSWPNRNHTHLFCILTHLKAEQKRCISFYSEDKLSGKHKVLSAVQRGLW